MAVALKLRTSGQLATSRTLTIRLLSTLTHFSKAVSIHQLLLSTLLRPTANRPTVSDRGPVRSRCNRSKLAVSVLTWHRLIRHPVRVNRWTVVAAAFRLTLPTAAVKKMVTWTEVHLQAPVLGRHRLIIRLAKVFVTEVPNLTAFTQTGRLGIRLHRQSPIRTALMADIQANNNKGRLNRGSRAATNPSNSDPLRTKSSIIGSRRRFSVNSKCNSSNNNNTHSNNNSTSCLPTANRITWITRTRITKSIRTAGISIRPARRRRHLLRATSGWTFIWNQIQRPIF